MRNTLVAASALAAAAFVTPHANAVVLLSFGQDITGKPITATENVSGTETTIFSTNVPVTITHLVTGGPVINPSLLTLTAMSTGPATMAGTSFTQTYSGSFSIRAGSINYLSGMFSDGVFGAGTGLTLSASSGALGQSASFTSSVIPAAMLAHPKAISLSFAGVTPPVSVVGSSLDSFTASVSGTFSASAAAVPEPGALGLLGVGLLGLGLARRRK